MSLAISLIAASVISYQAPPEPLPPEPLQIQNESRDFSIDRLYIAPAEERGQWGPDLLAGDEVPPGDTFTVTDIPPGLYDVRLVDDSGASCVLRDIDFERNPNFSFTGGNCYST